MPRTLVAGVKVGTEVADPPVHLVAAFARGHSCGIQAIDIKQPKSVRRRGLTSTGSSHLGSEEGRLDRSTDGNHRLERGG